MRKILNIAIAAAALTFASTTMAQKDDDKLEQQADDAMASGNYEAAGDAYERLYESTEYRQFLKKAGQAYIKLGPPGRKRAIFSLKRFIAKAKLLDEAKEGSALLAEATALPEPAAAAPEPAPEPAPVVAPVPPGPVAVVQPEKAQPPAKEPPGDSSEDEDEGDSTSDHESVVGHLAVGWYGVSDIPLATGAPAGTNDDPSLSGFGRESVAAPAIGIRYWLNDFMGFDAALGIHFSTGSVSVDGTSDDKQGRFGLLLHGGLPLSPWRGKHYAIVIIPELNLGVAASSVGAPTGTDSAPPDASLSGMRFDVGGRTGMEVHFGFIGIPQLSLEATLGAYLTVQTVGASVGNFSASSTDVVFTTASYDTPWDIFKSNVAARYYF